MTLDTLFGRRDRLERMYRPDTLELRHPFSPIRKKLDEIEYEISVGLA